MTATPCKHEVSDAGYVLVFGALAASGECRHCGMKMWISGVFWLEWRKKQWTHE